MPTYIKFTSWLNSIWPLKKIKPQHIITFYEQLAILINANIPIIKALIILNQDEKNTQLKDLITLCKNTIATGKSLSQTLHQHPQYFNALCCALINIGEQTGTLDLMLLELTNHLKKNMAQKRKIIKALLYPFIIFGIALVVTIILLVYVIPQFVTMFSNFGAKLPGYTQLIINFSFFLQKNWEIIVGVIVSSVMASKITHHHSVKFQKFCDKLTLNLPLFKNVLIYATISKLTKTLSVTLKSGMPLIAAIDISTTVIANSLYKSAMQKTKKLIINGKSFHGALEEQNLFPNKMIQLIMLGEETGSLDMMLEKISTIYTEALNNLTDNLNSLLEPAIVLILGTLVGGLVIGMYLPIFRLGVIV